MKTVVLAALALIVGLVLGGLAPRAELRRVEKELAAAREQAARAREAPAALPLALGLGSLVAARDEQARAAGPRGPVPKFVDPGTGGVGDEAPARPPKDAGPEAGGRRGLSPEALATARAAAELRAAQFRAAFFEEARLPPDRVAQVERTIATMNEELGRVATEAAEALRARGQKLQTRDFADLGVKLLSVYQRADDGLKATLDVTALAAKERTGFDLSNQVDLGAFGTLVEAAEALGVDDRARRPR
jgi:hypothetical protein